MSEKDKAILKFTERFEGSHKNLGPSDVDYRVYDKQGNLIAFALVIPTDKEIKSCYPLQVSLNNLSKLSLKRLNPVIIWACLDGIMYGKINSISGTVSWQGTSELSSELVVMYPKQKTFNYARHY
jgi:hypothetical protein|tara:strand:+ start:3817 stop:4191 length:375 start_codon:yes stop_codon:yes gene_type:complete